MYESACYRKIWGKWEVTDKWLKCTIARAQLLKSTTKCWIGYFVWINFKVHKLSVKKKKMFKRKIERGRKNSSKSALATSSFCFWFPTGTGWGSPTLTLPKGHCTLVAHSCLWYFRLGKTRVAQSPWKEVRTDHSGYWLATSVVCPQNTSAG